MRDEDDNTALMFAAEHGRADVVELLLKAGAKINVRNKEGADGADEGRSRGLRRRRPPAPTGRRRR